MLLLTISALPPRKFRPTWFRVMLLFSKRPLPPFTTIPSSKPETLSALNSKGLPSSAKIPIPFDPFNETAVASSSPPSALRHSVHPERTAFEISARPPAGISIPFHPSPSKKTRFFASPLMVSAPLATSFAPGEKLKRVPGPTVETSPSGTMQTPSTE